MIYTDSYGSPLGNIILTGDEQGLTGLRFTEDERCISPVQEKVYFVQTKEWLDIYFTGRDPGFIPRIHLTGSDFRDRVLEILCGIPFFFFSLIPASGEYSVSGSLIPALSARSFKAS